MTAALALSVAPTLALLLNGGARHPAPKLLAGQVKTQKVGPACHLLSDEQRAEVSELLGQPIYVDSLLVCDEPVQDPSMTCFLKPESWKSDDSLHQGDWVCFDNPASQGNSDDGY